MMWIPLAASRVLDAKDGEQMTDLDKIYRVDFLPQFDRRGWPEIAHEYVLDSHGPVVRQARYLADANGVATDIPNPDYVAVRR